MSHPACATCACCRHGDQDERDQGDRTGRRQLLRQGDDAASGQTRYNQKDRTCQSQQHCHDPSPHCHSPSSRASARRQRAYRGRVRTGHLADGCGRRAGPVEIRAGAEAGRAGLPVRPQIVRLHAADGEHERGRRQHGAPRAQRVLTTGADPALSPDGRTATVQAIEDSEVYTLSPDSFEKTLLSYPQIGEMIISTADQRRKETEGL